MIPRLLSIAIAASLLSSCAVLTVKMLAENFYVQGIMPNGAITRAKEFGDGQGKVFLRKSNQLQS